MHGCLPARPPACPPHAATPPVPATSITYIIDMKGKTQWNKTFPPAQWHTVAMGVAGSDIQDLVWRVRCHCNTGCSGADGALCAVLERRYCE